MTDCDFDIAIVGAGIAGASIAHHLAAKHSVVMLDAEAQPGYHATGRSVAFWNESYGGPGVQPLTTASRAFLQKPPVQFSSDGFLKWRGALHLAERDDAAMADALLADFADTPLEFRRVDRAQIDQYVTGLREGWDVGIFEKGCYDIDVAALHAAYLRAARQDGAKIVCNAALMGASYRDGGWQLTTKNGDYSAGLVINAAGAWADQVAAICGVAPAGIQPMRRTVVQLQTDPAVSENLPLIMGLDSSFYFKPETGGRIWLTPHDETPSEPCDAAPDEIDVARAIDRFHQVVDWRITKLEHKWAGLRSFAPDRLPVIGHDPANAQFFWMAGQGGFGIQTSPAASRLGASMIDDAIAPPANIDPQLYRPSRF